jgi:hypothetical protein
MEEIPSKKRRIMDNSLNSDVTGDPTENDTPEKPKVPRIERMISNRGNTIKYDKLAPQVIKDTESMTWQAALRKSGIPVGSSTKLRKHWEHLGLLNSEHPAILKPPEKTEGQLRYEDHAAFVGLKTPWKSLNVKERERWAKKIDSPEIAKKPSVDKTPEPTKPLDEKTDDILLDVMKVIVAGASEEEIVRVGWEARIKLAKLSKHLEFKLALVQSVIDYCNLDNENIIIEDFFRERQRKLATK